MAVTPESPALPDREPVLGLDEDVHASADARAYYERGTMQINEQASTYSLFMGLTKWGALAIACLLLWLVLWFQPGGSWFAGLVAAVVLAIAGVVFLRTKKPH